MQLTLTRPDADVVTLVVVDPNASTVEHLRRLLDGDSEHRYELIWFSSVKEALTQIRHHDPDLVFLEQSLSIRPQRNFLKWARRTGLQVPLIVLGEKHDIVEERRLIHEGASDYLARRHLTLYSLQRSMRFAMDLKRRDTTITRLESFCQHTGLPTQQQFHKLLVQRQQEARASGRELGLMLMNLDGFKQVNNSLGYQLGKQTLVEAVERIRCSLQRGQQLSRISEDQFALVLVANNASADLEKLIGRLSQRLSKPYRGRGSHVFLGCSMGCAVLPPTAGLESLDDLTRHAGMALHLAKKERGCSFRFFSAGMDAETTNQICLEPELINALRSDQFVLHYQPRIDLQSGHIVGAEALIRWQHPRRGLLMPGAFISLAEKTGLVVPMGYWVVHEVCRQIRLLHEAGLPLPRVGINLSFRQFQDEMLVPTIQRILTQQQIAPGSLEFELTETAMALNEEHISQCIRELSASGVSFSLDDFGTGYSSFAHLQKLPISTLKVDRSFVRGVTDNSDDAEIVRAIINLAHNLRMDVIAEGAETPEQVAFLKYNRCDQVQGYYFSPPVTFDALCEQLQQQYSPPG